jgi:serine phosphatase RsbU (regulator of sigma subunit)
MSEEGMFVTLVFAIVDMDAERVTYANAGHPPPVVFHGTGECLRLGTTGGLLGGIPDMRFDEDALRFGPGSALAIFTDGISEAAGELDPTGDGGVSEILAQVGGASSAQEIADAILAHAIASAGDNPRDDVAIVVVRARPRGEEGSAGSPT